MKNRTWPLVVLFLSTCLASKAAVFVTVDVTGSIVDSTGQPIPNGNEVRIGYFDSGFNIGADLQAKNLNDLVAHFNTFDTGTITTIFGLQGRFFIYDTSRDVGQSPASAFQGQQIYILAFETDKTGANKAPNPSFSDVLQFGLYTNPDWRFPNPTADLLSTFTIVNAPDSGTQSLWPPTGGVVAGNLQLAPVPEPVAYSSAALGILLLAAARNRWRTSR